MAVGRWIGIEAGLETLPLFIREGGFIPLGPVLNYVGEKPTGRIELLVALFAGEGESTFTVPVDAAEVQVSYRAAGGRHTITIAPSAAEFTVRPLGSGEVTIIRG